MKSEFLEDEVPELVKFAARAVEFKTGPNTAPTSMRPVFLVAETLVLVGRFLYIDESSGGGLAALRWRTRYLSIALQ